MVEKRLQIFKTGKLLWVSLPPHTSIEFLKSIPGSSWDRGMRMYAVESLHLERLLVNIYEDPDLEALLPPAFAPEELAAEACGIIERAAILKGLRTGTAEEEPIPEFLVRNGISPYRHQYDGARFLIGAKQALLPLAMGAGKTRCLIIAIDLLKRNDPDFGGALVLCDSGLKELVWAPEIKLWSDLSYQVIDGPAFMRSAQMSTSADVYIANPELLVRDFKSFERLANRLSVLILDDITQILNDTNKTRELIARLRNKMNYYFSANGTPMMNHLMELYSQVELVDPSLFRSKKDFKYKYIPRNNQGEWLMHEVINADDLIRRLAPVMFTRYELKNMPETVPVTEPITLTEQQRAMYEEVRSAAFVELSKYDEAESQQRYLIIRNAMSAIIRLRQICGDVRLFNLEGDSPKADKLIHLLGHELSDDKVVVFTQSKKLTQILQERLHNAGIGAARYTGAQNATQKKAAIESFTAPKCRVLLLTTAGGKGLNLQKVASAVILFDMLWNPKMMDQVVKRVARPGAKKPYIPVINLVAVGTVEQRHIFLVNQKKSELFDAVMQLDHGSTWLPQDVEKDRSHDLRKALMEMLKA